MAKNPATDWSDEDEAQANAPAAPAPAAAAKAPAPAPAADQSSEQDEKPVVAPAVQKDNFPTSQGEAYALLLKLQRHKYLGANASKADKANHAQYHRLCNHVFAVQQGTPQTNVDATSKHAFIGLSVSDRTRFEYEARTSLVVKKLLAAHDALVKENAELKKIIAE